MNWPLMALHDASVAYRVEGRSALALTDVSLSIGVAEIVAIIGESGSGKSTLGQLLGNMLPGNASITSGSLTYHPSAEASPVDVFSLNERQQRVFRWGQVAYVAQAALSAFNPVLRIRDHFVDTAAAHESGSRLRGKSRSAGVERRAYELLESVDLDPDRVWAAYPHELSGGMRQRVLIALSLLCHSRLVILDEPTTALDVLTQSAVLDVVKRLREARETTFIFISHDLSVATELADRVITMYGGRVVESAPSRDIATSPRHHYTFGLLQALPTLANAAQLKAIPGTPPDPFSPAPGCPFQPRCPAARDTCRESMPPLEQTETCGHHVACWFPLPSETGN